MLAKCSEFTYSNSSCFKCVGVTFELYLVMCDSIIIIIITSIIIIIIEVLYSAVPQYYEVQPLVTEPVICEEAVDSCDDTLIGDSSSRSLQSQVNAVFDI